MADKAKFPIPFEVVEELSVPHVFRNAKLVFPALMEPETRFPPPAFKTGIPFESEDCEMLAEFVKICEGIRDKFFDAVVEGQFIKEPKKGWKMKDPLVPTREVDEKDDDNDQVFITAKKKAVDGRGNDVALLVVDSNNVPIRAGTYVGGGSVANISCTLAPFYMAAHGFGVSIKLNAVQVTKLRSGSAPVNADSLFEKVEGGFTVDPADDDETSPVVGAQGDF